VRGTFGEVVEKLRRSTVQVKTVQVKAHRSGSGSGVIWSQDGQIITNAHVVEGAGSSGAVEVEFWDGRSVPGRIVKRDRRRDVAALQVQASGLPAATPGDSNALRVGELVVAVGNPFGFTGAASTGVVHSLNCRESPHGGFEDRSWVVSQLRLAPGNSGGPLANARGEVVGINTMIAGGLAFAIPSRTMAEFLDAPGQGHDRARLGVVAQPIQMDHSGRQVGFIVLEVIADSPADRASLLQGDILVGAGGQPFHSIQDLETGIHASRDGLLELQFRRGANRNIRTVTIRMAPASVKAA
jgi:serine protease Do